jgi:putative phage-type endonuclease
VKLNITTADETPKTSEAKLVCFPGEQPWREARRDGLGGSDIANISGKGYRSPLETWLEKTRQDDAVDEEASERLDMGKLLEDDVLELYLRRRRKNGDEPELWTRPYSFFERHDNPVFRASLDGIVVNETVAINAKTVFGGYDEWGDEGTDEVPPSIICQATWEMFVLGPEYRMHHTPAIVGGRFEVFEIARDDELVDILVEKADKFWECVKAGTPPPPLTGSEGERRVLARLYSNVDKTAVVRAEGEMAVILPMLADAIEKRKAAKAEEDRLKAQVIAAVGNSYIISTDDLAFLCPASVRHTIDSKRLKAEHPDIYEKYLRESVSRMVTLKKGGKS